MLIKVELNLPNRDSHLEIIGLNQSEDSNDHVFTSVDILKKYLNSIDGRYACISIKSNIVTLISDLFNQVPIFYFYTDTRMYISTNLSTLVNNNEYKKEINLNELHRYIQYGESDESETLWKGIFQVPPGYIIRIKNCEIILKEPYLEINYNLTQKSNINNTERLILETVAQYQNKDNKIGTFLSGGFDSSILSICNRILNPEKELHSFKNCSDHDEVKEDHIAQAVAHKHGLIHHEIRYDEIDLDLEKKIIKTTGLPEYTYVPFAYFWKSLEIASTLQINVLLGGEKGDQVLGMARVYFEYLYKQKKWKSLGLALSEINKLRNTEYKIKFLKGKIAGLLYKKKYFLAFKLICSTTSIMKLNPIFLFRKLNKKIIHKVPKISTIKNNMTSDFQSRIKQLPNLSHIENSYYLELVYSNDNHKATIQSHLIANSFNIEFITPFANKKLVNFILNADLKENFNDARGRGYALQSFSKYFPNELLNRKIKTEFSNLLKHYSKNLAEKIGEIPDNHKLWEFVDKKKYEYLQKEIILNPYTKNHRIYKRILSLKIWLDIYFE